MAKKPNKKPAAQPVPSGSSGPVANVKKQPVTGSKVVAAAKSFTNKQLILILAVFSVLLYANTLRNGYALDDVMVLRDNTYVTQGVKAIPELLATPHMRGYLVIPNDLYRPLSLVVFAIEYQFFGPTPAVGHFFNILWFAGCVIMLFLFLDKLFDGNRKAVAFIAALVFAAHPIHTEVVANIKSRDELMCYFFGFWALNIFMNYMRDGKMKQLLFGSLVFFLSLLSKETVISFAGIIPLLFFFYKKENRQRAIYITVATVAPIVVFMAIRSAVLSAYNANQSVPVEFIDNALSGAPSFAAKFATEVVVLGRYLKLMFIPYPLLCNYSYNAIPFADITSPWFWLSLAAYAFIIYVAVTRFMKDHKDPWAFAIIFYLATLFLFSNLPFLMGAELAERFAFFCSTGVCIAAGLAIEKWIIKEEAVDIMSVKTTKVLAVLVPVLLVFSGLTIARNADWKDNYTLYRTDIDKSPNDSRLFHYVATAIAEERYPAEKDTAKKREMNQESIKYLRRSLEIYPDYSEAHVELGKVFDQNHQWDSAELHDRRALQLAPQNFTATNNLGNVYLAMGKYQDAIVYFRRALAINPNFKYAYYNLGLTYKQLNQPDSTIKYCRKMLEYEPNYVNAYQDLGTAYFMKQNYDSAEYYFKLVLTANPQDAGALHNMGAAYLNAKKYPLAIDYFKKTIAVSPNYTSAYSYLGRSYFETGQYQAAIDIYAKEFTLQNKNSGDLPYMAMSYQKIGNMQQAKVYEAMAQKYFKADYRLP
jgi:protein O-mannosyl-transferase